MGFHWRDVKNLIGDVTRKEHMMSKTLILQRGKVTMVAKFKHSWNLEDENVSFYHSDITNLCMNLQMIYIVRSFYRFDHVTYYNVAAWHTPQCGLPTDRFSCKIPGPLKEPETSCHVMECT